MTEPFKPTKLSTAEIQTLVECKKELLALAAKGLISEADAALNCEADATSVNHVTDNFKYKQTFRNILDRAGHDGL